ncbi:uncharacterized protein A1O5_13249 [Cladophialophora psammophila CBS 110553]|uniref:Uncharacterized protein n=1 Tax=Cladophialophora psammophila CBS 110553 TaxID=1182543 RepID=W9VDD9_9EURO|nr:uncharacterized protein A1O5_13249 [Cladophialophora psammophila CBS 110553]EXJ53473.1 hypothetical protein A1O5_13249 [Cladophialophora psammophila CBS 110553]
MHFKALVAMLALSTVGVIANPTSYYDGKKDCDRKGKDWEWKDDGFGHKYCFKKEWKRGDDYGKDHDDYGKKSDHDGYKKGWKRGDDYGKDHDDYGKKRWKRDSDYGKDHDGHGKKNDYDNYGKKDYEDHYNVGWN